MKKLFITLIICVLLSATVFAASVSRNIPSRVSPGEQITVKLNINSISVSDTVKTFAIEESLPDGFSLSDWSIQGIEETKDQVKTEFLANNHKFEFTPTGSSVTITYTTTAPSDLGSYEFKATWFDLSGMSGVDDGKSTVTVRTISCGDGICEGDENYDNCESDCKKPTPTPEKPTGEIVSEGKLNVGWIIVIAIILIGLIVYFTMTKKKKVKS